jgi:hypothetical protein
MMEAEYNEPSEAMKFVLPLQTLIKTVSDAVGLDMGRLTTFKTTIWEDNQGTLTLAKLEPGRTTPEVKALCGQNPLVQITFKAESD